MITRELVKKALSLIKKRPIDYELFFNQLKSPDWILPLAQERMFIDPPPSVKEGGYMRFPLWPESGYLVRMSKFAPKTVLEVILKIPETDNVRVHEDLIDAILVMPENLAAQVSKWVKKEIIWIRKQTYIYLLLPEKFAKLIVYLSEAGQNEIALELTSVLLEVLPDPNQDEARNKNILAMPPEPRAKFDLWEYEEIFNKYLPKLTEIFGLAIFIVLCDLLESALAFARSDKKEKKGPQDYSYIWRKSIDEKESVHSHGIENILVSGIRDSAKLLLNKKILTVKEIIEVTKVRKWEIFRRLELYLLSLFPEQALDLVSQKLTNKRIFDSFKMHQEYAALLNRSFDLIDKETQEVILKWIEKGPNLRGFKTTKGPFKKEIKREVALWQRDKLSWFEDKLPGVWQVRYQELIKTYGKVQDNTNKAFIGPTTPKTMDELKSMSLSEILKFLKEWRPDEGWMVSSPEGLSRTLTEVIKQDPEKFAQAALNFQDLHPTYIRALILGLAGGFKGKQLDLIPILQLCHWVVQQHREIPAKFSDFSKGCNPGWNCDPDWSWTRATIVRFLFELLQADNVVPIEQRSLVWSIIEPITSDSDPTPEREAKNVNPMGPSHLAINSVRGEAISTTIEYALWLRRSFEKRSDSKEKLKAGFGEMPEVRIVLEEHLDILKDPSYAVRSVYGKFFPWLNLLDSVWVKTNLSKIFPAEKEQLLYYDAAWQTYIIFCAPYRDVFDILYNQYALAIDYLDGKKKEDRYEENLAEHLMMFYILGKMDLEDSILSKFWLAASDKVRGEAIEYIGSSLRNDKGVVPPNILERIMLLWQQRLSIAQSAPNPALYASEMSAFALWFVSDKFDNEWAIKQLIEALKISSQIHPSHLVVEKLAKLVTKMPQEVIEALRLIILGKEEWGFYSWQDTAREILSTALQTPAKQSAEDLIHYLGTQGYLEFGNLLTK